MGTSQADVAALEDLVGKPDDDGLVTVAPTVVPPPTEVTLPLGLWSPVEPLRDTAVVRELNGYDEEAMAQAKSLGASMQIMLERAVVSIGGQKVAPSDMEELCLGDRWELLLGIRRVTWGEEIETVSTCPRCHTTSDLEILVSDIPRNNVSDKVTGRRFSITLSKGEGTFKHIPGDVHRKMLQDKFTSAADLVTATILGCAEEIPGTVVITQETIKAMSLRDRRSVIQGLNKHNIGPDTDSVPVTCETCGEEYTLALTAGALFPF